MTGTRKEWLAAGDPEGRIAADRCKLTQRCYVIDLSRVCQHSLQNARNLMG
jgi:hypothetical protein